MHEVAIVGGGAAGLSTAALLVDRRIRSSRAHARAMQTAYVDTLPGSRRPHSR